MDNILLVEFVGHVWQDYTDHVVGIFTDFTKAYSAGVAAWGNTGWDPDKTGWRISEYAPNTTTPIRTRQWLYLKDRGELVETES